MTASEIARICITVGVIQALCDLFAYWRIYSKESYQRALEKRDRANFKYQKAKKDHEAAKELAEKTSETVTSPKKGSKSSKGGSSKLEKQAKILQRTEDDFNDSTANVARHHVASGVLTSIIFVILMRVLGAEYKGNVIGVLPFSPFNLLRRITGRGLDFGDAKLESTSDKVTDTSQACAFVFIYLLSASGVKFYVNKLFGTQSPPGADGVMSIVNSPTGQKIMKSVGIDPEDLKQE